MFDEGFVVLVAGCVAFPVVLLTAGCVALADEFAAGCVALSAGFVAFAAGFVAFAAGFELFVAGFVLFAGCAAFWLLFLPGGVFPAGFVGVLFFSPGLAPGLTGATTLAPLETI